MSTRTKASLIILVALSFCCVTVGAFLLFQRLRDAFAPAHVYFDSAAREHIAQEGFTLSKDAKNLYFHVEGFQDYTVFLAFSDTGDSVEATVLKKTGQKLDSLEKWDGQIKPDEYSYGPGRHGGMLGEKYITPLYDIARVTNGLFFQRWDSPEKWYLIYDRSQSRLYYSWQNGRLRL